MKTVTNFENSLFFHNLKKAFFSLQVLMITTAIPALMYVGLTHDDASTKVPTAMEQQAKPTAQGPASTKATSIVTL